MNMNDYQEKIREFRFSRAYHPEPSLGKQRQQVVTEMVSEIRSEGIIYSALGLVGEAGEVAETLKKVLRTTPDVYGQTNIPELAAELGDVLWYLTTIADLFGLPLEAIAEHNVQKLEERQRA